MNKAICLAWLSVICGMAFNQIGTPHNSMAGLWTISESLQIVAFCAVPAFLGFLAGIEE